MREGTSKGETPEELKDPRTERSLEESRKLILLWANELTSVDKELKKSPWVQERSEMVVEEENRDGEEDPNEEVQQRIMEWAKELQSASEVRDQVSRIQMYIRVKGTLLRKEMGEICVP